ncbi:tRNA(Glu)-specific nuclease WapA precursor [Clostridium tepidiprofundi DSM 19306]|uniref:tRNA(Glu)-specific nuclease WapA n=1 Tax=Clostridium tepidiprofundi DSM 19306 TaxID=1121338 RepID=A0A151AS64_9CLOT|nr:carbohydrate binding domain-containing protein [Clostridium tepidiprofundi]KYH30466.1 tRNA(Glu)-specific nuclease WapA precursor [Clostridium tepidiprofundi DSM 19306]
MEGSSQNKLSLRSKLQRPIMNYLMNHNVKGSDYWFAGNDASSTGSAVFSNDNKYIGNQSLKIDKTNNIGKHYFIQQVALRKGNTYTFSAYVKANSISRTNSKGAKLFVEYQDKTGVWKTVDSKYINGTTDWERYETKFTLPINAISSTIKVGVGIDSETGTAYFDTLQLEDGSIANRYNILENPNLYYNSNADTPYYWNKNNNCTDNDKSETLTTSDTSYPTKLDSNRKVFKFTGEADKDKSLYQQINISAKKGDVFVVSGWAKADSVPMTSDRTLGLDIALVKSNGEKHWEYIPFNENSSEWQYVSKKIVLKEDCKSITFYCLYYQNANTAYFDGLQLYKEEFGQSYTYDENGNVISTVDLAKQESTFEYDGNNNLIKYVDPKGNEFNYTYDTNYNIKTATTAENVKYSFEYDSYGNVKTANIGNSELFIKSTAEYTTNGNYIKSIEDSSGNKINYNFDKTKGTLKSVIDEAGKTTSYVYDTNLDRLQSVSKDVDGQTITNSYTYENDRIKTITHNGFNYSFEYDSLGNNKVVNVGTQNLITNTYEDRSSKLKESFYGNGDKVEYIYDDEDRIIAEKYNGAQKYSYEYDSNGNIGRHYDVYNNVNYRYMYDAADRLAKITDSNGNTLSYDYDITNNLSDFNEKVNNTGHITNYEYDKDNRIKDIYYNNPIKNDEYVEYFPLNGSAKGSKGTKPYSYNASFGKDENDKTVLRINSTDKTTVLYDTGINKNSGTIGLWFKTNTADVGRYLINCKGANNEFIDMYISSDNKLKLAVRNTSGLWIELTSSTVTVDTNTWYYAAFTWNLNGSTLEYALYLNNNAYTGTTNDFKDFTGAKTNIGRLQNDSYPYYLDGQVEQFTFYNTALNHTNINSIYDSSRGNRVHYDYDVLGRLQSKK